MKIRTGFVSNSSSSSFCIFGAYFTAKEIKEATEKHGFEKKKKYDFVDDLLVSAKEKLGVNLSYSHTQPGYGSEDDESFVIGLAPDDGKDTETFAEFMAHVKSDLEKVFGRPVDCSWNTEGWYDG